ncbi:MAG: UDP-N-acetylmuramoyl-L-alanyl-D-glutamate--2,6-diaminopimelate ligase [Cyclobacteriaceae bacterium]|nr:UDP-N-acetylmuramoyl-L-alanyl-D-glutamate--2,6-diaminopimelate ligase [Cyclobacteriaceae bacterium]
MRPVKDILYKVSLLSTSGDMNLEVAGICFDSRKIQTGEVFVAVRGTQVDGHQFIYDVIEKGAAAIVAQTIPEDVPGDIVCVQVSDSAAALGIMASNFYGNPSSRLNLVAVTGTNGKTTTVTLLHQFVNLLGFKAGLLSTICNKIGPETIESTHTTGDALQINSLLAHMVKEGCTYCFMEASSHAIDQQRIAGLHFAGAVFTNITHDHLDYHKTFDAYIKAKKKLFDDLPSTAFALVNADDRRASVMLQNTQARKHVYALKSMVEFSARILSDTMLGLEMEINQKQIWFTLSGEFNASNLLCVYAVSQLLEFSEEESLKTLSALRPVPGRFEKVSPESGISAIVDYAHTPDALKNILESIQKMRTRNEQLITVIGCGGNRDAEKRPLMADIACRYSDKVIFTSDNPRNEDPAEIIDQMMQGVKAIDFKKTLSIQDRREAIKAAVSMTRKGDILLVAGKGHETYQEIKGTKYHFDDRLVLKEMIEKIIHT